MKRINWGGSNYNPIIRASHSVKINDLNVPVERRYPGKAKKHMAFRYARANNMVVVKNQVGPANMITSRVDWLIMKDEEARKFGLTPFKNNDWDFTEFLREEIYSNDNH